MLPTRHIDGLQRSRAELLDAIGDELDLTLVLGSGNRGDELIWAGARALLGDRRFREIGVEELAAANGHTALICGSGAFSRHFHELMPHVLAVAELRFERVIVLPSTFDTSVGVVRQALQRTGAVVFARERESHRLIDSFCEARLAHDTSFFFDFAPYWRDGAGELSAFRTDGESAGVHPIPPGNDDISVTEDSMESWLERIAGCASVRTDRAHVMIAAALLGKQVQYVPGDYFKVPAIAEYALGGFPVRRLPAPAAAVREPAKLAPVRSEPLVAEMRARMSAQAESASHDAAGETPSVAAVVVSHNRPDLVLGALHSLLHTSGIDVEVIVVDNDSTAETRRVLAEACAEHPQIKIHPSDRNLGCVGARRVGLGLARAELVLFLDDDAELLPGALEAMVGELSGDRDAQAVSATVVLPDGRISHSGGSFSEFPEMVSFTLIGSNMPFDDPGLPPSGRCDWLAWTALLVRASLFEEFPLDEAMSAYFEDNEWALRVARAKPNSFLRSREALAIHYAEHKPWGLQDFASRARMVPYLAAAAHFYRTHGRLLSVPGMDVFTIMPELTRTNGTLDLAGARLVMELAGTHSAEWVLAEWMSGGLDPVLGVERTALGDELHESRLEADALRAQLLEARERLARLEGERATADTLHSL